MRKHKGIIFASIALASCLVLNIVAVADSLPKPIGYNQALMNICDYGAIPNDGKDDTDAFKITLNAGESVYVPPGVYEISESLFARSNTLVGAGTDKTVIVANLESTRDPIIWAGDKTEIRDLTIKFADKCIKGTEIAGERCGIITTANRNLCRGAGISNIRIQNVGTGLYAPLDGVIGDEHKSKGVAFSVTFESISVIDFSYRGIDIQAYGRTGNVYRNIYLSSGKYEANIGFYLGRAESEPHISGLTVTDSKLKVCARLDGAYGGYFTNFNIINTELTTDNTAFIYVNESAATINNFYVKNSAPDGEKQAFIRVGEGAFRGSLKFDTAGYLRVRNMTIDNGDVSVAPNANQYILSRDNAYIHGFNVIIDNYNVLSAPKELKAQYEAFNFDNRTLNVNVNGKNLAEVAK